VNDPLLYLGGSVTKFALHLPGTLFLRFLVTYILILVIPISLGIWVNHQLVQAFQVNLEENHLSLLRQTRDVVDQSIDDLEWRVFQIAANPRLNRMIADYRASGQVNSQQLREIVSILNSFTLFSSNLKTTFYLYLLEPPIVLTPYAAYRHDDFEDSRTYLQIQGWTNQQWHRETLTRHHRRSFFPATRITLEDFTNKVMIPYVQTLPIHSLSGALPVQGAIVFFLWEEEFGLLLDNIPLPRGGWTYIANQDGVIITGKSSHPETQVVLVDVSLEEGLSRVQVNGVEHFVLHVPSNSGWSYVAVLPVQEVLKPVFRLQQTSLLTLIFSLLLSMIAASIISYKRAKPLQNLIYSVRDLVGSENINQESLQALDTGVHRLIDQSLDLRNQLNQQESFSKNLVIQTLLAGNIQNQNEAQAFLAYLNLESSSYYQVIVVEFLGFDSFESVLMIDELSRLKLVLKELIVSHISGSVLFLESQSNSLTLLYVGNPTRIIFESNQPASSRDRQEELIEVKLLEGLTQIQQKFAELHHPGLKIGVGSWKNQLTDLAGSYQEALQVNKKQQKGIFCYTAFSQNRSYWYPIELEVRIMNAVRAGDQQGLNHELDLVQQYNFAEKSLSPSFARELFLEILGTYKKLGDQLGLASVEKEMQQYGQISDAEQGIKELSNKLNQIAHQIHTKKKSHNVQLLQSIQGFIESSLTDPNLGLYSVASQFSITESYLSFFFKEQTGENFSSYIEQLRIQQAEMLLKTTNLSIGDLAKAVGYSNDKTFRRVFKKLKGTSPSDYRQLQPTI
jgi:two-component system response regulator YesN